MLTDAEIAHLVAVAATNIIPEYQLAAWLMAVVFDPTGVSVLVGTRSLLETAGKGVRPKRY